MFDDFDIVVVGGGHAGCEAAFSCATLKKKTLLITQNLNNIAALSCNPAMGGVAKGQIIREIDALGGYSAINTDIHTMQFRMLNASKGPAMHSPRAQVDNVSFPIGWRRRLESTDNLTLWQDEVVELIVKNYQVVGVRTKLNIEISCKAVILTNGTFLRGRIHIGNTNYEGGRLGESGANYLTKSLEDLGFVSSKLKTGTPVRVDGRSIDFTQLTEQKGDEDYLQFSYIFKRKKSLKQRSCYIANTNSVVHDILRTGFKDSPMFQGRIQGVGPRYCPSIEDKIERFSQKDHHQLFIEPESNYTQLWYVNGFSSSLPLEVQLKALHHIKGFEKAIIERPGYAIEYDYFPPTQLKHTLETKNIKNLFFAGQINGTTGYEEAACQGLMAGINACQNLKEQEPLVLKRSQAYIGVLIDDLVTKGVDEPYRMFTSRAEYRILLRQDNADQRLTQLSFNLGLASLDRLKAMQRKQSKVNGLMSFLQTTNVQPNQINSILQDKQTPKIDNSVKMSHLLLRPQINIEDILQVSQELKNKVNKLPKTQVRDILHLAQTNIKYASYIIKEQENVDRMNKYENLVIKDDFDYSALKSLSFEAREKLSKIRPKTIAQAMRISGVSPADISVLILYISK